MRQREIVRADEGLGVRHVAHILGGRLRQVNEGIPPSSMTFAIR
jgi:hypothetical protein